MQSYKFSLVAALLLSLNTLAQSPATGAINGHDYVDLGLSVKWATCNVGAKQPSDYGDYFAWSKKDFVKDYNYIFECDTLTDADHDLVRTNWGASWRTPTQDECSELLDKCTWQWTIVGDHAGYTVTGPNGNSIFLPAAGCRDGKALCDAGRWGYYWSSTFGHAYYEMTYAYDFFFYKHCYTISYYNLGWRGMSVRPVTE